MASGFTANFGKNKGGLSTVEWAWLDENGDLIGSWQGEVEELVTDYGIYFIYETPPSSAYWIVFKTGDTNELFLISGMQEKGIVFYFGETHTGKSISYQFFTNVNVPTGPIQDEDIIEYEDSGIYLPIDVVIPTNAVFIKAWTDDIPAVYVAGAIDFDMTVYLQVPRTGPIQEEVEA